MRHRREVHKIHDQSAKKPRAKAKAQAKVKGTKAGRRRRRRRRRGRGQRQREARRTSDGESQLLGICAIHTTHPASPAIVSSYRSRTDIAISDTPYISKIDADMVMSSPSDDYVADASGLKILDQGQRQGKGLSRTGWCQVVVEL